MQPENKSAERSDLMIKVSCSAGYRGEESPERFFLGERKVEVVEILDRWQGIDHRYFKVKGDDKATYIIRHDSSADKWEMTLFDRTGT